MPGVNTHGGARRGAGRKPKPDAMVKRMYVLRHDQVKWLDVGASKTGRTRSDLLRAALDAYITTTEYAPR